MSEDYGSVNDWRQARREFGRVGDDVREGHVAEVKGLEARNGKRVVVSVGGLDIRSMRDYVTLDWDVKYGEHSHVSDVLPPVWRSIVRRAWTRVSPSGNVHVLVEFSQELTVVQRFAFRGLMSDDPKRMLWDTWRVVSSAEYFRSKFTDELTDYSHGVLFDMKDGKEAGPWSSVRIT